jgi:hypothetical protein
VSSKGDRPQQEIQASQVHLRYPAMGGFFTEKPFVLF